MQFVAQRFGIVENGIYEALTLTSEGSVFHFQEDISPENCSYMILHSTDVQICWKHMKMAYKAITVLTYLQELQFRI